MRNRCLVCMMMVTVVASSGCQQSKHQALLIEEKKPFVQYVESPQLAELILKPKGKKFLMSRDPFEPITTKEGMRFTDLGGASAQGADNPVDNIVLVGVVKLDTEYRAFLKFHNKSGVFKVQDKIEDYVIKDINLDQIVLVYEGREIVKKRGEI
jgi:hypothetical protein